MLEDVSKAAMGAEERSDEAPATGVPAGTPVPDPEVVAKPTRRQFSAEYRLRILEEADRCTEPGEVGRLLRREGLYSSHLSSWRKARRQGSLRGLTPNKRGAKLIFYSCAEIASPKQQVKGPQTRRGTRNPGPTTAGAMRSVGR